MTNELWNDSALWSIVRAQSIIDYYKIFISENYSNLFIFVHDTCVQNLIVSEIYKNENLCDWKILGIL